MHSLSNTRKRQAYPTDPRGISAKRLHERKPVSSGRSTSQPQYLSSRYRAFIEAISNARDEPDESWSPLASTSVSRFEALVGDATADSSPLFRGLEPYPDGWRASVRKPNTLPHYPMVLHRGGFPDGS
jgi:hypothetical protein